MSDRRSTDSIDSGGDQPDDTESLDEAFLTAAATATVLRGLYWVSSTLFELFVGWAAEVEPEHGEVAAWLSSAGRHLGEQAENLKALMPDSVLLGDLTAPGAPSRRSEDALEAVRGVRGTVVRLAIAQRVLLAQLAESCESLQRTAAPHADAPLIRALGFLLLDVRSDREEGGRLLGVLRDPAGGAQLDAAVDRAEKQLDSAGGLVAASRLGAGR